MRSVSDASAFPRDDRAWPPWAFAFSLVCGVAALAGSAALVASAHSLERAVALGAVFMVLACLEAAAYIAAMIPWLRGQPVPSSTQLTQVALLILACASFAGGPAMGGTGFCGLFAGVFLPSAWASRRARMNRALVDAGEARLAAERDREKAGTEPGSRSRRAPKVGPVLRETLAEDRDRLLAWVAATAVVLLGGIALHASTPQVLGVVLVGVAALLWVARRLVGGWLAVRDFENAATEPRRAYVVLLDDPNPRVTRPLLGVWNEEPLASGGRIPPPQAVYRCDEDRDALLSIQGGAVVHEAWLDTGASERSHPRWVAADAGIALPHRRAVMGRWYLASLIGAERPARARTLTMPAPNPTRENETGAIANVISQETPGTGHWARLFAWRLVILAIVAALFSRWS
jgi:hypothetical protein